MSDEKKGPTLYTAKVEGKNKAGDPLLSIVNEDDEVIVNCSSIEAFELVQLIPLLIADMFRTNKEFEPEEIEHGLKRLNNAIYEVALKLLIGKLGIPLNDVVRVDWNDLDKMTEDK